MPFYTVGGMLLILALFISWLVKSSIGGPSNQTSGSAIEGQNSEEPTLSFWSVLCHFDIWTCALCLTMSLLCLTFKEPVLALRLDEFNCDVSLIGIIFSLETISFTATSIAL